MASQSKADLLSLMAACLSGTASKTSESAETIGIRAANIAQSAYDQMHYNGRARRRQQEAAESAPEVVLTQ